MKTDPQYSRPLIARPFLEQLEEWINEDNFKELDTCEFKVKEMLKNFGRVEAEMEEDKSSFLWKEPMALAIVRDIKKLRVLCKKADKAYKRKSKNETE